MIGTIALAVLLVAAGTSLVLTYQSGRDWQDRAIHLDGELQQTSAALKSTEASLESTQADLEHSQTRISDLSLEKADALDTAELFQGLAIRGNLIGDQLQECAAGIATFMVRISEVTSFTELDRIIAFGDEVLAFCEEADRLHDQLTAELNALVR